MHACNIKFVGIVFYGILISAKIPSNISLLYPPYMYQVRPDNLLLLAAQVGSMLGKVVAEEDRVSLFIELLVDVFWKILTKNAACPSVKPVVNPGMYNMQPVPP